MTASRRSLLRRGAVALPVALAGCATLGSTGDRTATPTPTATDAAELPASETVGMSCTDEPRYFFAPEVVRVRVGGTVSWAPASPCRQSTGAYHPDNGRPLRIPEGAEPWQSPVMQGDRAEAFEHTFEVEGVYDYAGLHVDFGQVGTVVVGDPDPDGQPGLAPPQSSLPDAAREKIRELNARVRDLLG